VEYVFEPSEEALLEELLPRHVNIQAYRAFLEASASEHGARMTAMDAATNNAADMIDRLTLVYNRTRQAAITKELIEVVSSKEAMQ
jgi:F-type H+-transporting ATPase subunit gamma